MAVLTCGELGLRSLGRLCARFGLHTEELPPEAPIPGSFWGAPEAGLVGNRLYVRPDTPVHSALHEACHYVCMDQQRRTGLHTDAGGNYQEENGVCYLQILLANFLPGIDRERMFADMDAWGYSFRLGSARTWFETDAEDAQAWLLAYRLIDEKNHPTWCLRN